MTNPLVLASKYNKLPIKSDDGVVDVDWLTREHGKIETALSFATSLASTVYNVLDYGADPRGLRDSAFAIQAAIDACPDGGEVWIAGGLFRCETGLVVDHPVTIRGTDTRNTNVPGRDSQSMLTFPTDVTAGFTVTANTTFADVVVNGRGLGSATGTGILATGASVILDNVVVQAWDRGVAVTNGYYNKLNNSRIDYCKVAAQFFNCYNITASGTAFNGRQEVGARSVDLLDGSGATFVACSFESWRASGLALYGGAHASMTGCYFEGTPEIGDTARCVILSDDASVTAVGCHVYLTQNVYQWIGVEGGSTTGVRVFARNTRFIYPTDTTIVDVYAPTDDATAFWDVAGDNWQSPIGANVRYVEPTFTSAIPNVGDGQFRFVYPADYTNQTSQIDTVLAPYPATVPPTVASAGTIALPLDVPVVTISGTTNITTITATNHSRRRVTLVFQDALTVVDGSNLLLNGSYTTSADATLTLVSDGTDWYEVARSVPSGGGGGSSFTVDDWMALDTML